MYPINAKELATTRLLNIATIITA